MQAGKNERGPVQMIRRVRWLVTHEIEELSRVDTLGREGRSS